MTSRQLRQLLERSNVLRHACDVDLLLFFHRHPRSLLTSDQLAAFVGYGLPQIAKSLEALIAAGVIERSQNPTHYARMYRLVRGSPDGWLASIMKVATTRQGRHDVLRVLKETFRTEESGGAGSPVAGAKPAAKKKVAYA
jgi:predicted transcriptional regulator